MGKILLGVDGNAAYALLGYDMMTGKIEFETIVKVRNEDMDTAVRIHTQLASQ